MIDLRLTKKAIDDFRSIGRDTEKNGAVTSAVNILPNWIIVLTRLRANRMLALSVTISAMDIENITSADISFFTAKQISSWKQFTYYRIKWTLKATFPNNNAMSDEVDYGAPRSSMFLAG